MNILIPIDFSEVPVVSASELSLSESGQSRTAMTLVCRPEASFIQGLAGSTSWIDAKIALRSSSWREIEI